MLNDRTLCHCEHAFVHYTEMMDMAMLTNIGCLNWRTSASETVLSKLCFGNYASETMLQKLCFGIYDSETLLRQLCFGNQTR